MRSPNSKKLAKLEQITRAREKVALAKLSVVLARRNEAAENVAELTSMKFAAPTSAKEAEISEKWQRWKTKELASRNLQLAAIEAEFKTEARRCGRYIAEQAVVEELLEKSKSKEISSKKN